MFGVEIFASGPEVAGPVKTRIGENYTVVPEFDGFCADDEATGPSASSGSASFMTTVYSSRTVSDDGTVKIPGSP
jgi:hypothetical protein